MTQAEKEKMKQALSVSLVVVQILVGVACTVLSVAMVRHLDAFDDHKRDVGVQFNRQDDRIDQNDRSISAIQSNRFTSSDALEVWKEIGAIKADIQAMPREVPPQWFKDEVSELQKAVRDLNNTVIALQVEMRTGRP